MWVHFQKLLVMEKLLNMPAQVAHMLQNINGRTGFWIHANYCQVILALGEL